MACETSQSDYNPTLVEFYRGLSHKVCHVILTLALKYDYFPPYKKKPEEMEFQGG